MTSLTDTQVVVASGGLVELGYLEKTSTVAVNVGSGSQVSVVGPLTVVSDGSPLMVEFFCEEASAPTTAGAYLIAALWVDGVENTRTLGVAYGGATGSNHGETLHAVRRVTLAAGSHTIEIKGWSSAAANFYAAAGGTAAYAPMFLRVSKIVQATQWPAVTTGTIICTSTTRPASPFEGQQIYETDSKKTLSWTGSNWLTSYRFVETVTFTNNGTFSKSSYPWLSAIRVRLVGGGGAGGGITATGATTFVASGGGGGGAYAESFITNISSLESSVTVTVGTGGTGTSGNGNGGGTTSFGSLVSAVGGGGGIQGGAQSFWIISGTGAGGSTATGDFIRLGERGGEGNPVNTNGGYGGHGGASALGAGGRGAAVWQAGSALGEAGKNYGGGGAGGAGGANAVARNGASGAPGIVLVDLFT
jgi:hypothetical protein